MSLRMNTLTVLGGGDPTHMPTPNPEQTTRFQCRHIFTDGHRCGSICLRKEIFCYYHHTARPPVQHLNQRRQLQSDYEAAQSAFILPDPEDRSAIQAAIGIVLRRIALNGVDPRRAGLLLYGLQIATQNLPKAAPLPALRKPAHALATVEETVLDPEFGILAPPAEFRAPKFAHTTKSRSRSRISKHQRSAFADLLTHDWDQPPTSPEPSTPDPITLDTINAVAEPATSLPCPIHHSFTVMSGYTPTLHATSRPSLAWRFSTDSVAAWRSTQDSCPQPRHRSGVRTRRPRS
jgi:hypothetical protein